MINLLIKLIFKFSFLEKASERFVVNFISKKDMANAANEAQKKLTAEQCRQDLIKVLTYEKLGKESGLPAPKIYKKG